MSIILRFSGSSDFAAMAVKLYTWSWCSHVETVIEDTELGNRLYGAHPATGVNFRPLDSTKGDYVEEYRVDLPTFSKHAYYQKLLSQQGKNYDWLALAGMVIHRDWGTNHTSWFCSELVTWAFAEIGHPLLRTEHKNRITPENVLLSPLLKRIA